MSRIRNSLTYANVMATVAVFLALGGGAYAATQLPKNSVGARQIKKNAVTSVKIKKNAVTSAKVKDGSLLSKDFAPGQLAAGAPGPQGPKGDKGDAGTPGQNATKLFAAISAIEIPPQVDYGSGVTSVTRSSAGQYTVTFDRSVANCVVQVTPGFGDPIPHGGVIPRLPVMDVQMNTPFGHHDQVLVEVYQPSGTTQPTQTATDSNFMITAFC